MNTFRVIREVPADGVQVEAVNPEVFDIQAD